MITATAITGVACRCFLPGIGRPHRLSLSPRKTRVGYSSLMLLRPHLLICALSLGSAAPVAAQQAVPAAPRTVAGASKFIQDMLTRGTAVAKPWPGFVRSSRITSVGVKGGCLVTLTLADKSALSVKLDQVVAIRPLYSANAPQASVEARRSATLGLTPSGGAMLAISARKPPMSGSR